MDCERADIDEDSDDGVRVWLVERTYSDDEQNLIILTYATPDGEQYFRKERALTSFGDMRDTTAALNAEHDNLGSDEPSEAEVSPAAASLLDGATLYRSPNCSCCLEYTESLETDADVSIDIQEVSDLAEGKDEYAVPRDVESCHTVGEYYVEGTSRSKRSTNSHGDARHRGDRAPRNAGGVARDAWNEIRTVPRLRDVR